MTWIAIRAHDVWLFRDGKPFNAGQDNAATSIFPPTPFTVQGALRHQISAGLGVSLAQYRQATGANPDASPADRAAHYIGAYADQNHSLNTGQFRMNGVFIGHYDPHSGKPARLFLPSPADLVYREQNGDMAILKAPELSITSDLHGLNFSPVKKDYENKPDFLLTEAAFADYMKGKSPTAAGVVNSKQLYETENRFGVAINSSTSYRREGQLYQIGYVRPHENIVLLTQVSGLSDEALELLNGTLTLGGERRTATSESVQVEGFPHKTPTITGRFKVIFLTPTYFKNGWEPENGNWDACFGAPVKLLGANLYRPLALGGWSSVRGGAMTMYNFVRPGSVYYFETQTSDPITLPDALTQSLPNVLEPAHIGFGQYAVVKLN
jgi:CRISPR-associated protein Cmr3